MLSSGSLAKVGLVVSILSLVFQLLGFTCPGWLVVTTDLSIFSVDPSLTIIGSGEVATETAVWFVRVCVYGDSTPSCSTVTEHNTWDMGLHLNTALSGLQEISWLKAQVLLTLALIFCLVTIATVIVNLCHMFNVSDRTFYIAIAANSLISGVLVFPPVIDVSLATENSKTAVESMSVSTGSEFISIGSPFALVLSAAGLVLAVVASIVFIIAAVKVKSEKFSTTIFPSSFLSPAILKIGNFPANISMSDRIGHLPPNFNSFGEGQPPPIGSKDEEPLKFQNGTLNDDQDIQPFVLFPPENTETEDMLFPPGDTTPVSSLPPPYKGIESSPKTKRFLGSLSLGKELTNNADDETKSNSGNRSPSSPTSKTVKIRKLSENDLRGTDQCVPERKPETRDTLGKDLAQTNGRSPNLLQNKAKGKSATNRSPTSPRKTVKINTVSEEQIEHSGRLAADIPREDKDGSKENGKSGQIQSPKGKTVKKHPYLSGSPRVTKLSKSFKPSPASGRARVNPQVTQKKITLAKVQEDKLLMK